MLRSSLFRGESTISAARPASFPAAGAVCPKLLHRSRRRIASCGAETVPALVAARDDEVRRAWHLLPGSAECAQDSRGVGAEISQQRDLCRRYHNLRATLEPRSIGVAVRGRLSGADDMR